MTDNASRGRLRFPGRLVLAALMLALAVPAGTMAQVRQLSQTGQLLDGVAAVVNDGVVLKSELREEMQLILAQLRDMQTQLPPQHELEQQILERLVLQRIQLQRAERLGLQVTDEILNRALAAMAAQNGITLDQLPEVLAGEGIDYAVYRRQMRAELIIDALRERDVLQQIFVSEREIEQYLARQQERVLQDQDYHVSHILISVPGSGTPAQIAQAQSRVEEIMRRLDEGEDFASVALSSSDAQTALAGGALGWRRGTELPTLFAEVVPGMQQGDVVGPIRAGSGFQIVRLDEVRGTERVMSNQVRARHILLSPTEIMDDEAVRQRLLSLRDQILADDNFSSIARSVSEDPESAVAGGDLGWHTPETFVPEFAERLRSLEIGELSEPFRSAFGWHIVEVLDRRVHDATDEMRRREAAAAVRQRKFEEEVELWLRRLRDEAYVDYRI